MTIASRGLRPLAFPALDGLRFYAAMLVFLVHLVGGLLTEVFHFPEAQLSTTSPHPWISLSMFFADGHHGVDIFFVVSGFLMARIAQPGTGWWKFVGRRWMRIYPAFLASLLVATAIHCKLYGWPFQWRDFLLNLVFYNALQDHGIIAYNHVSWSLGYEFAFYLLVPLLAFGRSPPLRMAAAGVGLLIAFYCEPYMRASALFGGFMLGCIDARHARAVAATIPMWLVFMVYSALIIVKSFWPLPYLTFHLLLLPLILLGVLCIAYGDSTIGRMLSSPLLRRLGTWSYSIYLFHPLVLALVMYQGLGWVGLSASHPVTTVAFTTSVALLLTIAVASTSYRLFEAPYFRRRHAGMTTLDDAPVPAVAFAGSHVDAVDITPPLQRRGTSVAIGIVCSLALILALAWSLSLRVGCWPKSGAAMIPATKEDFPMRASRWYFVSAVAMALAGCGQDSPEPHSAAPATSGIAPLSSARVDAITGNGVGPSCNIETIAGAGMDGVRPTVGAAKVVNVAGWYADPAHPDAALELVLVSEDSTRQWSVPVPARIDRPDVAEAMHAPALHLSGFDFNLDLSGLPAGGYGMYLSPPARDPASVCGMGRGFTIK